MFPVYINDGVSKPPSDDIYYIIGKDGIYLKKKLGPVESCTKVDAISILNPVESYGKLHLPKIPGKLFSKVYGFFKESYNKYRSESAIILYFNDKIQTYKIVVPTQEVSGAAVSYEVDLETKIPGYRLIGTIHSHANFSAFHSGIDINDEKNFDGLHITIGNVDDEEFSLSTTIVVNASRFLVETEEYVEDIINTNMETKIAQGPDGKIISYTWGSSNKKYKFNEKVSKEDMEFNPKWMDKVSEKKYSYQYPQTTNWEGWEESYWNGGGNNYWGWDRWRRKELSNIDNIINMKGDSSFEKQNFQSRNRYSNKGKKSKYYYNPKNGNQKNNRCSPIVRGFRQPIEEPTDEQLNMFRLDEQRRFFISDCPCEKCIHKDLKMDIIIDEIDEKKEELEDEKKEIMEIVKLSYPDLNEEQLLKVVEGMNFED